jgi:hypothetical protein
VSTIGDALKALLRIAVKQSSKPPEVRPAQRPDLKLVDGGSRDDVTGDNGLL